MEYILCNFYFNNNSLLEQKLTNDTFKNIAYNAKIKDKAKNISFLYVMIPKLDYVPAYDTIIEAINAFASSHTNVIKKDENYLLEIFSIYMLLRDVVSYKFSFDIVTTLDDKHMDIFYSDGSSSKSLNMASYATIKLLGESYDPEDVYDDISQKTQKIQIFTDTIVNGTNNIGELNGVRAAIQNKGRNKIQVIVSDSQYSLNCFREWIYNWKSNGYKGSNRKEILNCQLIKDIQKDIEESGKIYLFKWIKGHADTKLNEMCDTIAKQQLNIE